MSIYNPTVWVNDSPPPINASNLNKLEQGVVDAHVEIASQAVAVGSVVAYASTLYSNIGAQSSQIAAQATTIFGHTNAIASLIAHDVILDGLVAGQAAAIASNTAGVASMLPIVASHTVEIAELYATQGAHSTQLAGALGTQGGMSTSLAGILATQGYHATQIFELQASQAANVATDAAQSSALAALATQIFNVSINNAGLVDNQSQLNRSGNGPVDLWGPVEPVGVTATSALARAIALRYSPVATLGVPASGIVNFGAWLLPNAGVASPLRSVSFGVIDGITGSMLAWSGIQTVPSVATGLDVQHATYGVTALPPNAATQLFLVPGAPYYLLAASDDAFRLSMLGLSPHSEAAAQAKYELGLAYEYALPSGLNLASYGSFRLPLQAIPTVTSIVPSPVTPQAYPAVFLV